MRVKANAPKYRNLYAWRAAAVSQPALMEEMRRLRGLILKGEKDAG